MYIPAQVCCQRERTAFRAHAFSNAFPPARRVRPVMSIRREDMVGPQSSAVRELVKHFGEWETDVESAPQQSPNFGNVPVHTVADARGTNTIYSRNSGNDGRRCVVTCRASGPTCVR
jgi:hypothetical protein